MFGSRAIIYIMKFQLCGYEYWYGLLLVARVRGIDRSQIAPMLTYLTLPHSMGSQKCTLGGPSALIFAEACAQRECVVPNFMFAKNRCGSRGASQSTSRTWRRGTAGTNRSDPSSARYPRSNSNSFNGYRTQFRLHLKGVSPRVIRFSESVFRKLGHWWHRKLCRAERSRRDL